MAPLSLLGDSPDLTLHHDPNCAVSQDVLAALQLGGVHAHVRRYGMASEAPTRAELRELAGRLVGDPVDALVRRSARYAELGLDLGGADSETVIEVLGAHPELLQCPILDDGTAAMLGTSLERAEAWAITGHVIDTPASDPLLHAA